MQNKRWIGLWVAVILSALAGCSSNDKPEPAPLQEFKPDTQVIELWDNRIGGYNDQYLMFEPALTADRLFVMNADGFVVGLHKASGRTIWRQKLDQQTSSGISVDDSRLYLALFDGRVLALSQEDGKTLWQAKVSSEVLAPPQSNGDLVVVQTIDGKVFGLDAATGHQRWSYDSVQPVLTLRGTATPLLTTDVSIAGFANGDVVALDNRNGNQVWLTKVGVSSGRTELERLVDIDGGFLLDDGLIYTVGYQGKLAALTLAGGQEVWSKTASSIRTVATGYSNLYVVNADDNVLAYSKSSQAVVWRQDGLAHRSLSSPAVLDNAVVVGDGEGYVHFLSQVDGHFMARIRPDIQGVRARPVVENGIVYILGDSGRLSAWRITPLN